jgi:hypothetical protein
MARRLARRSPIGAKHDGELPEERAAPCHATHRPGPLDKLTGTDITRVYRKLEAGGRQDHKAGSPLSARTIRYCHTILKAALREAVNQGLIAVNPADKAQPPAAKEAKAPEGEQLIEGSTKTGKGRSVDLHPRTVAALRSWRVARAGLDLRLARDDALIFGDLEGVTSILTGSAGGSPVR